MKQEKHSETRTAGGCEARSSRLPRLLGFLILAATMAMPGSVTAAKQEPSSPGATLADFFRWEESIPFPLQDALRAYQEGRFFAAIGSLDGLMAAREPEYALDDAQFLRALSLIALGWDEVALPSLSSLLEADPPGPYYVPALLELIEAHNRAERWGSIADAWERYVERPLRSGSSRGKRVSDLLFEFGEIRSPTASSTKREKNLLSKPKELAVILEKRRERPSDRLLYRSGLALLRLGRHEESLHALLRIGVESPYYPYARYSIAQDLFALGQVEDACRTLSRLRRYPKITPEERALGSRSQVLHAAIRFETGEVEQGIRIAQSIPNDDPEAPEARLLITNALLVAGAPALALTYDTAAPVIVEADARRALTIGAAYASIGDMTSAAGTLRTVAGRVHEARSAGAAREEAVDQLRRLAEDWNRQRREGGQGMRAHVSRGVRVALAHDGPWNLGTMLRRMRAALGAGPYRQLEQGTTLPLAKTAATENRGSRPKNREELLRLAYLASPRRATIELALDRLADIESEPGRLDAEASLRILNGYLAWLERAPSDPELRRNVARHAVTFVDHLYSRSKLEIPTPLPDPGASLTSEVTAFRHRLLEAADALRKSQPEIDALEAARNEVVILLHTWVDRELRELLQEREADLLHLEFDLEVALSETLAGGHRLTQLSERPAPGFKSGK